MKKNGFTLIEVVIATMIMAGAILLVSTSWSGSLFRIRKTQLNQNITELLQRKATELTILYKDKAIGEIADQSGDFGSEYPQYRWTFAVQPFEMPDLSAAVMDGQGASQEILTIMSQMRETISKSILEGTITVFVRNKDKEASYSVTTYFVDYSGAKIGGLGGGGP